MEELLNWAYSNQMMVQIHPSSIGPTLTVLVSNKDCKAAEGYIRPDEPSKLMSLLENLKQEVSDAVV